MTKNENRRKNFLTESVLYEKLVENCRIYGRMGYNYDYNSSGEDIMKYFVYLI